MIVSKAYEFRLYPTNEQKLQIGKTIGSARYVYNCFLAKRKELYGEAEVKFLETTLNRAFCFVLEVTWDKG